MDNSRKPANLLLAREGIDLLYSGKISKLCERELSILLHKSTDKDANMTAERGISPICKRIARKWVLKWTR